MRRQMGVVGVLSLLVTSLAVGVAGAPASASGGSTQYWAQVIGSSGAETAVGNSIALRSDGRTIVGGRFQANVSFPLAAGGSASLSGSSFKNSGFIGRMAADGSGFDWVQAVGGTGSSVVYGVALTEDDTVIAVGSFAGTVNFPTRDDSITLTTGGATQTSIFVAAMNADDSTFAWARQAGTVGKDSAALTVAVAGDDTIVVGGKFTQTAAFASLTGTITLAGPNGGESGFTAGMSLDDTYFAWAQSISGPTGNCGMSCSNNRVSGVAVSDDTIFVTGVYRSTVYVPTADDSIPIQSNAYNFFLAAMSTDDTAFTWVQTGTAVDGDINRGIQAAAVAVDADDSAPIITGRFGGTAYFPLGPGDDSIAVTPQGSNNTDIFVARFNTDDSYISWVQAAGSSGNDEAYGLAVSPSGSPVVTGHFAGTMAFPASASTSTTLTTDDSMVGDMFVAMMNADDSYFSWAQKAGGFSSMNMRESASAVVVNADDSPIVTGFIASPSAVFPSGPSSAITIASSALFGDMFVGIIGGAGSAPGPGPGPGPGPAPSPYSPPGAPTGVTAVAGDASATVSWMPPASTGSFAVSSYQVVASPGGRTCLASAPLTSCEVTALVNGTSYTFTARALSGAGWGPFSGTSSAVIPERSVTAPGGVRNLRVVAANSEGVVTLRWRAPLDDGGAPVIAYRVFWRQAGTGGFVRVRPDAGGETFEVGGLTPGKAYWFRVRAGNAAGFGPAERTPERVRIPRT